MPRPTRLYRLVGNADLLKRRDGGSQMQLIPRTRHCVPVWPVCMREAGQSSVEGCAYRTGTLYATPTGRREGVRCRVCGQVLLPLQLATRNANTRNCTPDHTQLHHRAVCRSFQRPFFFSLSLSLSLSRLLTATSLYHADRTTEIRNGRVLAEMLKG